MKLALIAFTMTGLNTAERIRTAYEEMGWQVTLAVKCKFLEGSIKESTSKWAEEQFAAQDVIIFVGASGIAVRSIAPYVTSKKTDPAVLVVDECGKFVISLLSGHLGGANELTQQTAAILSAIPVITTATDLHGKFAVDVFSKKNGCTIFNMKAAKEVSASLLAEKRVGFYSEVPVKGKLPEGLVLCDEHGNAIAESANVNTAEPLQLGIAITVHTNVRPFSETVVLVPPQLVLGLGCRKGKEADGIRKVAEEALARNFFYKEAVAMIASIDLKKEEPGILALSEDWKVPFETYPEEALLAVPGEFTSSAFVKKITGVDNVCERSAVLASMSGTLLQRKVGADGVTTAFARKEGGLQF